MSEKDTRQDLFPRRSRASSTEDISIIQQKHSYRRQRSMSLCIPLNDLSSPAAHYLSQLGFEDENNVLLEEGRLIDKYLIGSLLSGTASGECRAAIDIIDGSGCAIKVAYPQMRLHFERELRIWSRLRHANLLPLIDWFEYDDESREVLLIAVSPLIQPGNLLEFITKGKLSRANVLLIMRQLCEAVRYLHREALIVHRDLKLENILINDDGRVYVCDFGLSTEIGNEMDGYELGGSLHYVPPEDLDLGGSTSSTKRDIWSLGVILYTLLEGRLPFWDAYAPRLQQAIRSGRFMAPACCTEELAILVINLLRVDPKERPEIEQVIESLTKI